MILHAYLRHPTESFTFDHAGTTCSFAPNSAGHVVGDVEDEVAAEILEVAPDAYREYKGDGGLIDQSSLVLTSSDGDTVDLTKMTDEEVRAFGKEFNVRAHYTAKGDKLRLIVADGVRAATAGAGSEG